ncbi:amidohydrolase [uncultured Anaerococcus sp.]|uniref:amidohydrolase n=1 Tax=uncultured Anaerococcus sp. TaxID=293428 RepID=UPI0026383FDC|nr:amidohydrolase [uncultured Anaerococcus sp.]
MTIDNQIISNSVNNLNDYLINTRRYLHKHPELSAKEIETSKFLKSEVAKLGLKIKDVFGTGFYAILDTGRPGNTLGIRTDIDALPIVENERNLKSNRICISENEGVFHACGHDGHMTILLGAMKILVENKENLSGKIIFIFEEGEETGTGIGPMIEALKNENIDAIYGNHLASFLDTGKLGIDPGPVMAGFANVDFTVKGKGGHGSRPDLSISPIFAATNIINALATAWVNRLDVTKTVTLGLGSINGGSIANVIPNEVRVTGTLRYFDVSEGKKAVELVKKVGDLTAKAHECEFIENEIRQVNIPVINDDNLARLAKKASEDIMPGSVKEGMIWFASESFSEYSKIAKTVFTLVGTKNEDLGSGAEHHNEYFDLDENSLAIGIKAMVKFAVLYLS